MCTVTFFPRKEGYLLAMNRDEKLSRVKGLPPAEMMIDGCHALYPSEPRGGTWIAVNEHRACLALINWYSVAARVKKNSISRGEIIPSLITAGTLKMMDGRLAELPLNRINPFRLVGVFHSRPQIIEWRWDLRHLVRKRRRWRPQQWISSGFDEPKAQKIRHDVFRHRLKQRSAGTLGWLRALHRSHTPGIGPFSTCMHRHDAATVSYNEILVSSQCADVCSVEGSPCEKWCNRITTSMQTQKANVKLTTTRYTQLLY